MQQERWRLTWHQPNGTQGYEQFEDRVIAVNQARAIIKGGRATKVTMRYTAIDQVFVAAPADVVVVPIDATNKD